MVTEICVGGEGAEGLADLRYGGEEAEFFLGGGEEPIAKFRSADGEGPWAGGALWDACVGGGRGGAENFELGEQG